MGVRYGQAKYGTFKYGKSPSGFAFRVEIRDSSGAIAQYANNQINSLDWQFDTRGGCRKGSLVLKRDYDNLLNITDSDLKSLYSMRIYIVPDFGDSAVLFYDGIVFSIRPTMKDGNEAVRITTNGYSKLMEKKQIYINSGEPKIYTNTTIGDVVDDLCTNFMPSEISIGTVDAFDTEVTTMKLNGSLWEAVEKVAEIVDAEWGVDADKNFFFLQKSSSPGIRFKRGYEIESIEDEIDYDSIVNRVVIEGGDVDGEPFRAVFSDGSSISDYGRVFEERIRNSAVLDYSVAERLALSYFRKYADYSRNIRITLPRYNQKIESTLPIPLAAIDKNPKVSTWKYGTFKYGAQKYTSDTYHAVKRIDYSLNDTSLRVEIEFNQGKPDLNKKLERIQFEIEQQRQAAGV